MKSIAEIAEGLRSGRGFSIVPPGTAMSFFVPCMEDGRLTERAFIYPFTPGRTCGYRPFAWIVRSMEKEKLLAYQKCADRDFMEGGYDPEARVNYQISQSLTAGEYSEYCKKYARIYQEIKKYVFMEELDGQKAGLLRNYIDLMKIIVPAELMTYYEGLSPEFFSWIKRAAGQEGGELADLESSFQAKPRSWQIQVLGKEISMSLLIPYRKMGKMADRAFLYSCKENKNMQSPVQVLPYAWLEIDSETGKVSGFWQRDYRDFSESGQRETGCSIPSLTFEGREKEILNALGKIRECAFKESVTDEEKNSILLFKEIFYGMISTELLRYYQELSPVFFKWLNEAGGMMG